MGEKKTTTVMIVEDDDQLLFLIDKKLTINKINTILVNSTKRFTEIMNLSDLPDIDLFWLDFYLGDGDAFGLIEKIKSIKKYKDTPIIIVSNSMDETRVKYMLSLGVQKYFLKAGSSLQELIDEVVKYTKEN